MSRSCGYESLEEASDASLAEYHGTSMQKATHSWFSRFPIIDAVDCRRISMALNLIPRKMAKWLYNVQLRLDALEWSDC